MKKRILSMIIAVVMILTLLPAAALSGFAAEAATVEATMMFRLEDTEGGEIEDRISLPLINTGFDNLSPSTWSAFPLGDTTISFANASLFPSGYLKPDDLTLTVTDSNSDGIGEVTTTADFASITLEEIGGDSVYVITLTLEETPKAEITSLTVSGEDYDAEKKLLTVSEGDTYTLTLTVANPELVTEDIRVLYVPRTNTCITSDYGWTVDGNTFTKTFTVDASMISDLVHPFEFSYYSDYTGDDSEIFSGIYMVAKDDTKVQAKVQWKPVDADGNDITDVSNLPYILLNGDDLGTSGYKKTLFSTLLIGENTVQIDKPEGLSVWLPASKEFTLTADADGNLTVSGDERLKVELVDGVHYVTVPFISNETVVSSLLYFKPIDTEGNPIEGELDAYVLCQQGNVGWLGSESLSYGAMIYAIGTNIIEYWDYCPDGYLPPKGLITFDVDEDGKVTVTGGNATVEPDGDKTYLVVTLYGEDEVVATDPVRISGASLALGADLTVNYTAEITDEEVLAALDQVSMRFTMNGKTTVVALDEELVDDDGHYVFPFEKVAPQQLADNILAELLLGEKVIATKDQFSVLYYLWSLQYANRKNDNFEAKFLNITNRLIEYGYSAQKYTGYSPETLDNVFSVYPQIDYEAEIPTETDKNLVTAEGVTLGDVQFKSVTVWFDTVNKIRVTLNAITENTKLVVKINDDEIGTTYENLTSEIFYTEGISALNFADVYTFELYEGETLLQTLTYSVNSYVYSMMGETEEDGTTPTDMAKLAVALYNYGLAAETYRSIPSGVRTELTAENAEAYSYNGETATYDPETGWTPVLDDVNMYSYFIVDLKAGDTVSYKVSGDITCIGLYNEDTKADYYVSDGDNVLPRTGSITVEADGTYLLYTNAEATVKAWLGDVSEDENTENTESTEITTENAEAYSYNGATATYDAATGWTPVLDEFDTYRFFTVDLKAGDRVEFLLSGETPAVLIDVNNNGNSLISSSIASSGMFTVQVDGTYVLNTMLNVNAKARITPCVEVDTFDELNQAMENGDYIKLAGDIDMGNTVIAIQGGVDVTLDLNGYDITASTGYPLDIYDATLTVKGNGSITSTGGEAIYLNSDTSKLTVEGGSITGYNIAVYVGLGEAVLNGGTFKGDGDAVYAEETVSIVITGGSYSTDPSAYLADGYSATLDEETGYYVVAETVITIPADAIELTDENVTAYTNGTDTATYSATDGWAAVSEVEFDIPTYFTVSLEAGDAVYFKLSGRTNQVGLNGDGIAALALENVSQGVLRVITTGEYQFYSFSAGLTAKVYVVKGGAAAGDVATEISWGGPLENEEYLIDAVAVTAGTIASASVTIGEKGWVAYYNEISAVVIAEGLTAYVVTYQDGSRVKLAEITDGIIPVNTPVLLKGGAGEYSLNPTEAEGSVETNLLTVSDEALTRENMDSAYIYCVFAIIETELEAFVSTIDIPAYQPYFIAENNL